MCSNLVINCSLRTAVTREIPNSHRGQVATRFGPEIGAGPRCSTSMDCGLAVAAAYMDYPRSMWGQIANSRDWEKFG